VNPLVVLSAQHVYATHGPSVEDTSTTGLDKVWKTPAQLAWT